MGRDRYSKLTLLAVALITLSILSIGCTLAAASPRPAGASATGSGSPVATSRPTARPSAPTVALGADIVLDVGASVSVEDHDVIVSLLAADVPGADCTDCPNQVRLLAVCPPDSAELEIAFSGGMEESALDRARRGVACELEFYVVEVHDGNATIRIDTPM